jgi:hypothetical protein
MGETKSVDEMLRDALAADEAERARLRELVSKARRDMEAVLYADGSVRFSGLRVRYDGTNWVLVMPTEPAG